MTSREEILNFLVKNKFEFENNLNIIRIGLFGSYARGENKEKSDIDLIVEFEPLTENLFEKKLFLKELFKKEFSIEVDICREKYIKSYFKDHILKSVKYV